MAGGIDWFRWHHGTVTDHKFPLVARRAGASVAEVVAVWACLLEFASMNESERGLFDHLPDFEAIDCALGLAEGRCEAIFGAMQQRGLIDSHLHITAWPKRQPKREDDSAADRKRRQREREHELQMAVRVTDDVSRSVTQCHAENDPCHAQVTASHDRGEESREEKREAALPTSEVLGTPRKRSAPSRGSRLPEDWTLSKPCGEWAMAQTGFSADRVRVEAAKFSNHWWAESGSKASKRDWVAAWRTWVLKASTMPQPMQQTRDVAHITVPNPEGDATQRYLKSREMDPEEIKAAAARARGMIDAVVRRIA